MSYFFHCVESAKEDGQGLTGGHLSLLFPTSEGGRVGCEGRVPPLLTKGPDLVWDSWSHRLAFRLSSKRPGRFMKRGTGKIPGEFASFSSSTSFFKVSPLSPRQFLHYCSFLSGDFVAISLTDDHSNFNFLTDDLSYFCSFFSPPFPPPLWCCWPQLRVSTQMSLLFLFGRMWGGVGDV